MKFKTSISKVGEDDLIIRNEKLSSLMKGKFTDSVFLLLSGRKAKEVESKLFESMLISVIDHGMGVASSLTSRFVMSTGNSLNTAVGAGVLALGDLHGGAIENSMKQLLSVKDVEEFVSSCVDNKQVIFGFGHKHYKEDPRAKRIVKLCKELNFTSKYLDIALQIEKVLEKKKGKKICLNVDGVIAAVLLEMGFSPEIGKGFFIIGRTPGLVAHAVEEKLTEKPVRRVDEKDIEYLG
tara:strand:+ start:269 stop:979 length:711 start_codon:yes stop_codon:yes gene_type:complete